MPAATLSPGRRVVVHAGFHKTGTTSAQRFLMANGKHIWPHVALVLPGRIAEVLRVSTLHSTTRDPLSLAEFGHRLTAFLRTIDLGRKRALCISAENLSGLMPGRSAGSGYHATDALMAAVARAIEDGIGPEPDLTFHFSTRAPDAWLRSTWWQNLRSSRLREDFDSYAQRLGAQSDLGAVVDRVRASVAPYRVVSQPLEMLTGLPFGPATPLIDLLGLPAPARAALQPVPPRNVTPAPDMVAAVLALNRSDLDADAFATAKAALLADAG